MPRTPTRAMVAALKASVMKFVHAVLLAEPGCGSWSCRYSFSNFSPGDLYRKLPCDARYLAIYFVVAPGTLCCTAI